MSAITKARALDFYEKISVLVERRCGSYVINFLFLFLVRPKNWVTILGHGRQFIWHTREKYDRSKK